MKDEITQEYLQRVLRYDPETGVVEWTRVPENSRKRSREVQTMKADGYLVIKLHKVQYRLHRVIWMYVHGRWPKEVIDHINGDVADNRLTNLRETTVRGNAHNRKDNTSGMPGVCRVKDSSKWQVKMKINGRDTHLGIFDSFWDAVETKRMKYYAVTGEVLPAPSQHP